MKITHIYYIIIIIIICLAIGYRYIDLAISYKDEFKNICLKINKLL